MTPPMYERVKAWFVDSGLTSGFKVQTLLWTDSSKLTDSFIVFRSAGGSAIQKDLGADYYVMVDIIGAKSANSAADELANRIIDFVQNNPMPNDCIGHIQNMGGYPRPVQTTEGRLWYGIQFSVTYGE